MKKIGITLLLIGIGLIIVTHTYKNDIIIQMGIRAYSFLSLMPIFAIGAGIAASFAGFWSTIKTRLKSASTSASASTSVFEPGIGVRRKTGKNKNDRPALSSYANSYNPKDIRLRLDELKKRRPDLEGLLIRCEAQMDAMDMYQEKLRVLLDLNEAEHLRKAEQPLDEVEQFICKNFRKVINRGIVSSQEDDQVFSRDDNYSTQAELIEAVLRRNQSELENINRFLADIADRVSEQDTDETSLQAWMGVIRNSLKNKEV